VGEVASYRVEETGRPSEGFPGLVEWRTLIDAQLGPSVGLAMGVAEIPPHTAVADALHRHSHHEAYYVVSGTGIVHLDDETVAVAPGTSVFIAGGTRHAAEATGTEALRLVYVFAADSLGDVVYDFGP